MLYSKVFIISTDVRCNADYNISHHKGTRSGLLGNLLSLHCLTQFNHFVVKVGHCGGSSFQSQATSFLLIDNWRSRFHLVRFWICNVQLVLLDCLWYFKVIQIWKWLRETIRSPLNQSECLFLLLWKDGLFNPWQRPAQ